MEPREINIMGRKTDSCRYASGRFNYNHYYSMKKKSAFHSVRHNFREGGFFKLRVLFGVLLCFAAVTIVLFALGKASAQPRTSSQSKSIAIRTDSLRRTRSRRG